MPGASSVYWYSISVALDRVSLSISFASFFACGPQIGDDPNSHRDLCAAPFDGRTGRAGPARRLFNAEALGYRVTMRGPRGYDVGPDPNRILVQTNGVEGVPAITLLENLEEWIRRVR